MILRAALLGAIALGAVAPSVACSTERDTAEPVTETVEDPPSTRSGFPTEWSPDPLDWQGCDLSGTSGECATLEVPLDWDVPDGDQIELALARVPASGERTAALLVNPGGPGGSGVEYLPSFAASSALGDTFDLVSWDPRGVGESTAVDCDDNVDALYSADPTPDDAAEQAALENAAATIASDCAAESAALLEHLNTDEVARDLEAIRIALGNEKLNYMGFSYGTYLGQTYAELFGDRIRAMTLDGVVDPSQGFEDLLLAQASGFDSAFETQAAQCAAEGADRCGVDDLASAYDTVLAQLEEAPVPAGPFGEAGSAELTLAALYVGYLRDGWLLLGPAIDQASKGDGELLADLADSYLQLTSYGAYASVVCTDSAPPSDVAQYRAFAKRAEARSPRFGALIAWELLPCATWAAPPQGEPAPITAPDAPAILVVGNTGDPATPLANAEVVADSLESGVLLVVDMDGHTAYGSDGCATGFIDDYFRTLATPAPRTTC